MGATRVSTQTPFVATGNGETGARFRVGVRAGPPGAARARGQWLLDEQLRSANIPPHRFLMRAMMEYTRAAAAAAQEINGEDQPRLHEKDAWAAMVERLWRFADSRGFSTAINKSGFVETPPFVSFVRELQRSFIGVATWHTHSDATLGAEILKATREARELKSE